MAGANPQTNGQPLARKRNPRKCLFPSKLREILADDSELRRNCIEWDISGDAFTIYDERGFEKFVLSRYVKGNFQSFLRQLTIYGFKKVSSYPSTFFCPLFTRYEPNISPIKRKRYKSAPELPSALVTTPTMQHSPLLLDMPGNPNSSVVPKINTFTNGRLPYTPTSLTAIHNSSTFNSVKKPTPLHSSTFNSNNLTLTIDTHVRSSIPYLTTSGDHQQVYQTANNKRSGIDDSRSCSNSNEDASSSRNKFSIANLINL